MKDKHSFREIFQFALLECWGLIIVEMKRVVDVPDYMNYL